MKGTNTICFEDNRNIIGDYKIGITPTIRSKLIRFKAILHELNKDDLRRANIVNIELIMAKLYKIMNLWFIQNNPQ